MFYSLKPLDVRAMKALCSRVNVIPVIAKADTLTRDEIVRFKQNIMDVLAAQEISIYDITPEADDDEEISKCPRD